VLKCRTEARRTKILPLVFRSTKIKRFVFINSSYVADSIEGMHKKHWLICFGALALVLVIGKFVPRANWGTWAIILVCPAMHLFMMKGHGGHKQ